ncbi:hypothetical protein HD806DRAFT_522239 [Xylariaceae sp. AK1471]|nr:hypothetical protein HD806DRAFT_522239 [Xylariaceae sp. AK1471]
MEIHREPHELSSEAPLLLDEIRARLFASVYTADKALSGLLDKAPLIPKRYCNRKLPLSTKSNKILHGASTLDEILYGSELPSWNEEESYQFELLCAGYLLATFREDILNVRFESPSGDHEIVIRQLPSRITAAWKDIPLQMHLDPATSNSGKPLFYDSNLLYLEYLDIAFRAQQLLFQSTAIAEDQYLQAALNLVTMAMSCERQHCRRFGASRYSSNFLWVYALPGAMVLANAMQQRTKLGLDMPCDMSWTALYRQLSVLVSGLEASTDPRDGIDSVSNCGRIKILSEQLDRALNAQRGRHPLEASMTSSNPTEIEGVDSASLTNAETFADLLSNF